MGKAWDNLQPLLSPELNFAVLMDYPTEAIGHEITGLTGYPFSHEKAIMQDAAGRWFLTDSNVPTIPDAFNGRRGWQVGIYDLETRMQYDGDTKSVLWTPTYPVTADEAVKGWQLAMRLCQAHTPYNVLEIAQFLAYYKACAVATAFGTPYPAPPGKPVGDGIVCSVYTAWLTLATIPAMQGLNIYQVVPGMRTNWACGTVRPLQ